MDLVSQKKAKKEIELCDQESKSSRRSLYHQREKIKKTIQREPEAPLYAMMGTDFDDLKQELKKLDAKILDIRIKRKKILAEIPERIQAKAEQECEHVEEGEEREELTEKIEKKPANKNAIINNKNPDRFPEPQQIESFFGGAKKYVESIDGFEFAKNFPAALLLLGVTGALGAFLSSQTTQIYSMSGFQNPELTALGSVGIASGFAAVYSVKKNKMNLVLCIIALAFELFAVSAGTSQADKYTAKQEVLASPSAQLMQDKAIKAKEKWTSYQARFKDKSDKMFGNLWFKKTYVAPAFEKYENLQSKHTQAIETNNNDASATQIKVIYRCLLVVLLMFCSHAAISKIQQSFVLRSQI